MTKPRGIVVCVDYDDLLRITLERNMRFMESCLVVTTPSDTRTQALVRSVSGCSLHVTDAFYRNGGKFNKGLSLEEGFDVMGRAGWIFIWDADTLLPDSAVITCEQLGAGNLYSAPRRILQDPREWDERMTTEQSWLHCPVSRDLVHAGYFQLFHADDKVIATRPWYDVTFTHAGGGDGYFQSRWSLHDKRYLPFQVLHLGPRDTNWFGRATYRADGEQVDGKQANEQVMREYLGYKGWRGNVPVVEQFEEHVEVEGHQPSGFVLKGRKDR